MNHKTKIPVTILTGYLGSGKTTLVNRILSEQFGQKIAVIVNEIGSIGIDNELIVRSEEEVVTLTNGCLCCTVREDLLVVLKQLVKKCETEHFEGLLIETTGLANPGPIIQTFFLDPIIQQSFEIDGVVTVVDAFHVEQHFCKGIEAKEQIAFADTILLNKIDLVTDSQVKKITSFIRSINPTATITPTINCEADIHSLLHISTFRVKDDLHVHHHEHNHLEEIVSFVLREERPLDFEKINEWMAAIVSELGEYLYRYKGILNVQQTDKRVVFQGVHTLFAATYDRKWRDEETRMSEIVFIGKGLNKEWFEQHFHTCVFEK